MGRKKNIINQTRDQMAALGIYKPEFEPIIEVYSQLREQYNILTKRFVDSDYNFSEYTNAGKKKAPLVTTIEALRKDILTYAAQLGLTPQGLLKADDAAFKKKKTSALAAMLKSVDSG
jgi:phage terminase small subunit